jgi:hypothetical protein
MASSSEATYEEVEAELLRVRMVEMQMEIDQTSKRIREQGGDPGLKASPPKRREVVSAPLPQGKRLVPSKAHLTANNAAQKLAAMKLAAQPKQPWNEAAERRAKQDVPSERKEPHGSSSTAQMPVSRSPAMDRMPQQKSWAEQSWKQQPWHDQSWGDWQGNASAKPPWQESVKQEPAGVAVDPIVVHPWKANSKEKLKPKKEDPPAKVEMKEESHHSEAVRVSAMDIARWPL